MENNRRQSSMLSVQFSASRDERGQILLAALTIALVVLLVGVGVTAFAAANYRFVKRAQFEEQALSLAEAGIEHAIRQLNLNSTYGGETDTPFGPGVFTVTVTGSGQQRTIEATGSVPDSQTPRAQRTIRVTASISSTSVQFFYGVQVDSGGLSMGNNARVNGNVYSNGSIVGGNGATIMGDAIVASELGDEPEVAWEEHNADQFFATSSSNRDIAQSFIATESGTVPQVAVFLGKVGNPSSNITLRLTADNSGRPATSSLASGTINRASVGITPSWVYVSFSSPPNVISGTKYWIVLDYNTNNPTNYWNWRKDGSDAYPGNTGMTTGNWSSGSAVWTNVGGDLAFQVWIGGTATRIEGMIIGNASTGTARANTFINTSVHGSSCPNQYCLVENPPREKLPISDGVIADWKNDAAAGGTHTGNFTVTRNTTQSLGPRRITGDLVIENGATLIVTGTLHVQGNLVLDGQNGAIRLDPSYGANSGLVVTDGWIHVSNNFDALGSGTPGSYIMLITTADHTAGPFTHHNAAIDLHNRMTGSILYAGKGKVFLHQNVTVKEVTAWGLELENNAVVTYEFGLQNATFTSGPGAGWSVVKGTWQEIK
jgi:Tfp pilus assembly protein PilX